GLAGEARVRRVITHHAAANEEMVAQGRAAEEAVGTTRREPLAGESERVTDGRAEDGPCKLIGRVVHHWGPAGCPGKQPISESTERAGARSRRRGADRRPFGRCRPGG